ncbi:uncharacterized protein LOC133309826 [Gastrolobium bilobum]|uniref:uncharacterized protein LOC133309826 n=1 Tax=Gastrolobium bilobum TaxID=150636 RepID=UPI002AB30D1F|nr:uncharacterized protein LOC133309826 [Gastrolobium bilobum]
MIQTFYITAKVLVLYYTNSSSIDRPDLLVLELRTFQVTPCKALIPECHEGKQSSRPSALLPKSLRLPCSPSSVTTIYSSSGYLEDGHLTLVECLVFRLSDVSNGFIFMEEYISAPHNLLAVTIPKSLSKFTSSGTKFPRIENKEVVKVDFASLERDHALRPPIWKYPINQQDEIRRAYLKLGPFQCKLQNYPFSGSERNQCHFCSSWFDLFPSWLEYSPSKDAAFCLPCYLSSKPGGSGRVGLNTFVVEGFRNWKKVNVGENCAFLRHVGKNAISMHKNVVSSSCDLMNQSQHIEILVEKLTTHEIATNRLRLQVSVDVTRWLALQRCAFRGHDENENFLNQGNLLEMIKFLASYNQEVAAVVLEKTPQNASYSSPQIQKEILHVFSQKIKNTIQEEISNAKFCLIVDEASDVSRKEHMAIVLRFVDKDGFIRERFFGLVHVEDTSAKTLKQGIFNTICHHNLDVQNIRGQGYDGASHMRGEWNGLQDLICAECPTAYYVHCLAHRLQLALVAASHKLSAAQASEIARMIAIDELKSRVGLNQIGTLHRAGATRWSSHYNSICSLFKMFKATCEVLDNISNEGKTSSHHGDADNAYSSLTSFDFIIILHLMKEIMGITEVLCQALQRMSQDISNALHLVSTTKELLQKLRETGWEAFLVHVQEFCIKHDIDIPDMSAKYIGRRGRARNEQGDFSTEKFCRVNIFCATIDYQLKELNSRLNDNTIELLALSMTLYPKNRYKSFNSDDICKFVGKFYSRDFTEQEKLHLKMELQHFELDIPKHPDLINLSTTSELCQGLARTGKSIIYPLIDRVIRLVLILPVSTATTERSL